VKTAAIYARVSSDRQKEEQTITSQTSALRAYAGEHGYLVPEGWVYEDEGWSGATLVRPGLERVRDLAAQGQIESVLVYSPDRLSRKYAYQVLLLEEFARAGVEVVFVRAPRVETPEEVLLVQFQGMMAEYEKAQISERTRRGKRHRARCGVVNVLSGAPYGYRYVRKADGERARYEVFEPEAVVVREVFRRYTEETSPIGAIARWLTDRGIPTRTGKPQWERSTIWGMLRNPAYQGTACFQKTATTPREHVRVTRRLRQRSGVPVHPASLRDRPREEWIEIPVPALVTATQYALAQARLAENRRFAARHTKVPSLLQGLLVCRSCGYAYYRTSTQTSRRKLYYYRCLGSDDYRYPEGRRCTNRPVRQDALDALVWDEVIRLLENPSLVRQEIDRRLAALRTEHPITGKRESLVKTVGRLRGAIARLIEAYQEELLSLEELRQRMPPLRQREATAEAQLAAFEAELTDAETYVTLAQSLEGFLAKLHEAAQTLALADRQRVVRLILKEVQVGPDTLVLRHSIPVPGNPPDPGYLLRGRSRLPAPGEHLPQRGGRDAGAGKGGHTQGHLHVHRVRAVCRRPGDPRERPRARGLAAEGGSPATAGGAREARSQGERGEEPGRGPDTGGGVRVPGLHHPPASLDARQVVGAADAGHEAADGVAAEAAGGVPALGIPARGPGDRGDQSDLAWLGELLPSWERGPVFFVREDLGRAEGTAPSDEGEGPTGLRLATVE
jgi:site-specific DNA recombinase